MFLRGETTQGGGNNISDAIFFSEPAMLRSRSFNTGTGEWSALNEAFFTIDTVPADSSNLVISELHYHPSNPATPAELAVGNDRDDFEFVEFLNIGASTLDLTSVRFDVAINFAFPTGTVLPAGERVLLVRKRAAFEARYGPIPSIQSFEYTGRFSNDGERVLLTGAGAGPILDFVYNDQLPWPASADGLGPSMVLLNPFAQPDHGEATNWTASRFPGGSPGVAEPTGITYAAWAASHALVGGPDDDDDEDTVSNYLEYFYGSRPDLASEAPGLNATIQSIEVGGVVDRYLTVTFPENLEAQGSLTLEISADLLTWSSDPTRTELVSRINHGDGTATVSLRLADPVSPAQRAIFVRLRGN
jgi:hypothetical protein